MIGTTLGHYHIETLVREGGMGDIYRAVDAETGNVAAVKVLRPSLAADRVFLQRFRREVRALKEVQHPNVVQILDVGSEEGVHYYAMEFLEQSLADLLRAGPLEPRRAAQIAAAAARGLEAVHAAGICHRDVKPSNILLGSDGRAKVTDFGIARVTDATRMTQTGSIMGTPAYMAPEQVEEANVDGRADIYALGVVLYEMVVGRPPFDGKTPLDILRKHRFSLPEPPKSFNPRVPGTLSHLIEGMLAKSPSRRPSSMAMVAAALEHIEQNLAGELPDRPRGPSELTSTELGERFERSVARVARWSKRIIFIAAGLVLAYVGWRVVAYLRLRPADYLAEAKAFEAADEARAIGAYEALLKRFADAPEAAVARERLEVLRENERRRRAAAPALHIGPPDHSAALRAQTAYIHLRRAEEQAKAGEIEHARRIYRMIREHYADTPWGARADQRLQELDRTAPEPKAPAPKAGTTTTPKAEP